MEFDKVFTNERIFLGWDADVIIPNLKIAILWDGPWHRKKITEKHSLIQVQNRDKLKRTAILKSGFRVYVIEDDGKFNEAFVRQEFLKFKEFLNKK